MILGDTVTIVRPGSDEYGNPHSFDAGAMGEYGELFPDGYGATEATAKAFVPGHMTSALFAVGTDVRNGDRLVWQTIVFEVSDVITVRSPSRSVLMRCTLTRTET